MLDLFLCCDAASETVRLSRVRSFTREEEGRRKRGCDSLSTSLLQLGNKL